MARTPLTTPTQGNTSWWNWANQLNGDVEALYGGGLDASTKTQVRTNIGAAAIVQMTQAAYTALSTKDPNTLYVIVG